MFPPFAAAYTAKNGVRRQPRKGLEGCEAATAQSAGAGAIAEPRKARFLARSAGNAPKLFIKKAIAGEITAAR